MKIRKNDKAYLQDFKIDIKTKKDNLFQELCLLFDKPQFLNLLPNLRQTYKVGKFFSLKNFGEELDNHFRDNFKKVKIDLSKYKKASEVKKSFPDFYDLLKGNNPTNLMPEMLDAECYLICFEFNKPPYFLDAIEQAIFCGSVDDSMFHPTKAEPVDFSVMGVFPTLERIAIFISPTSTYEDVKEEFRKAKEMMKTDKRLSYYQPRIDIASNIRKYRRWYWEKISGKTYEKISNEWIDKNPKDHPAADANFILKGVQKYQTLLKL